MKILESIEELKEILDDSNFAVYGPSPIQDAPSDWKDYLVIKVLFYPTLGTVTEYIHKDYKDKKDMVDDYKKYAKTQLYNHVLSTYNQIAKAVDHYNKTNTKWILPLVPNKEVKK